MFCSNCGVQMPDAAHYCMKCGRQLRSLTEQLAELKAQPETVSPTPPPPSKSVEYDPRILQTYAERLYARATTLVIAYVLGYGLVGAFLLGGLSPLMKSSDAFANAALMGFVLLGVVGGLIGNSRAFEYRLKAQQVLCQVRVEENTRPGSASHGDVAM